MIKFRLKPCPCCEHPGEIVRGGPGNHYIRCVKCRLSTDDRSILGAVVLWNTRPNSARSGGK